MVWSQDFTTMKRLAVSARDMGTGTWIAHTPSSMDWFTFGDPGEPFHPFALTPEGLTIRVQKDGHDPNHGFAGYSGGLLSSMDGKGKGFAQQYGYFEASMRMPGGTNTWPAFWLLDAPSLTDKALPDGSEIDVTESYGNWGTGAGNKPPGNPNFNTTSWHRWGHNGNPGAGGGSFGENPGMTTGFHTYGVDMEPDFITWYYDRRQVWKLPTFLAARRPMFVLLNFALGGGTHNNADGSNYDWTLTPNPSDLKVKYVAAWASPNSPNYRGAPATPTGLSAVAGKGKVLLTWAAGGSGSSIFRSTGPPGKNARLLAAGITAGTYLDTGLTDGVTYRYAVSATNTHGNSARSLAIQSTPGAANVASAVYRRTDTTTRGDWTGLYGGDGYRVFGDTAHDPAYATVSADTDHIFAWAPTTDSRAPRRASKPSDRIAAELHSDTAVTFDINLTDGKAHRVAFYFLDWDHKGEVNTVEIRDAVFGDLLETRSFPAFADGHYAVYELRGPIRVRISNAAPQAANAQATISGIFFGDKPPGPP